jgi:putative transposase
VGLEVFATLSTGERIENPRFYRKAQARLRAAQRRLSRRRKGSGRRRKARGMLARAHLLVQRQRLDFCRKTANALVQRFDAVYVEKLNIRGMLKNHPLAKSIADAGWGIFLAVLPAKAEYAGRVSLEVPAGGTSIDCSDCGEPVPKKLSQRWHSCPYCGAELHRDHNAGLNIKSRGGQLRLA